VEGELGVNVVNPNMVGLPTPHYPKNELHITGTCTFHATDRRKARHRQAQTFDLQVTDIHRKK
jgi:hypothetical protein